MTKLNKDLFSSKNQSFKTLVIRLVVIAVLAGIQPWVWDYTTTRVTDFQQKRFQSDQITELNRQIDTINQAQQAQSELVNQLDLVVPNRNSLAQVIDRLERLAGERSIGLKITDIRDEPKSSDSVVSVDPVTIVTQLTGTPAQVLQYFDAVEHLQSLTVIHDWSLNPAGDTSTAPGATPVPGAPSKYMLTMNITFFLQPPTTSPTPAPNPNVTIQQP